MDGHRRHRRSCAKLEGPSSQYRYRAHRGPNDDVRRGPTGGRRYLIFAQSPGFSGIGVEAPASAMTRLSTSMCGLTREYDREARRLVRLLGRSQVSEKTAR